jgi:hypothetical protein
MTPVSAGMRKHGTRQLGGLLPVRVPGRQVRFDARYLPPAGRVGAAVDRILMGRVARASVGDFFDRLTARLDSAGRSPAEART